MKILQSEKNTNCKVETIVEVSPEEYDAAANKTFIKNRSKVIIPGFRPGKAPRRMVERMYGADIFMPDTLELLYPDIQSIVKDNCEFKIIDQLQVTDFDLKKEEGILNVTVSFSVYPEVTLGEYKGLSVPKKSSIVPESEIDTEIANVRIRNSRIESVDRPAQEGDTVIIDFEGFVDGESFEGGTGDNFEIELGSNRFIPGFEEGIFGMSVGEERDLELVFPDDYEESLAGKPVVFKVKLNEVKEKQLPDLDDEFVKDVSELDTLAEYKADIRDRLEKERQKEVDEVFEQTLFDKVLDGAETDLPEYMVEEQLDITMRNFVHEVSSHNMDPNQYLQMMGTTAEDFRERYRASCEKRVKMELVLDKIADLENIEVSDEEIEKEYEDAAEDLDKEVEEIKKSVPREGVIRDLRMRAANQLVINTATALDPEATEEEAPEEDKAKKPATKKSAPKKPASKKTAEAK